MSAKNCDGCIACCNGTLNAEIHGELVNRTNPCSKICYEQLNCSDYDNRPPVCSSYKCLWILREDIPEWMKPSESGVLLNATDDYIMVHSVAGTELKADIFLAVLHYAHEIDMGVKFFIETKNTPYGDLIDGTISIKHSELKMGFTFYE